MKHLNPKRKSVVVVVDLAKKSRRDFLSGIFDRCGRNDDWSIHILQSSAELTPQTVLNWNNSDIDGVIVAEDGMAGTELALSKSSIPAIIVGSRRNWLSQRKNDIVFVRMDDERIGEFAAEQLLQLGMFNSAAFIPAGNNDFWSELRGKGFCSGFERSKIRAQVYHADNDGDLSGYLERLPKPAAIFAASDKIAYQVTTSLRNPRATIPGKIVLLGVDDDELLCNSAKPRLSSINPDHYQEGAIAQRELGSMMRTRKTRSAKTILCDRMRLVIRESTVPVAPAASLIARALDFIDRQCTDGITPDDVAAHIGISRRLLDLRFHELHPFTIAQVIMNAKLDEVKRCLDKTSQPIKDITSKCGFANANHLKNLFRKKFGMSMREWRVRKD